VSHASHIKKKFKLMPIFKILYIYDFVIISLDFQVLVIPIVLRGHHNIGLVI
jgi:hypothetical protein